MKIPIPDVVADFVENAESYADGKQVVIADNMDFGIEITLEGTIQHGNLYAELTVWGDQDVFDSKTCCTEKDFKETLEDFYESYITPHVIDTIGFAEPPTEKEPTSEPEEDDPYPDEIAAREEELDAAVYDFVTAVYGCDPIADTPDYEETFDKLKDNLLKALAEFDPDIYRPTPDGDWYPYANK